MVRQYPSDNTWGICETARESERSQEGRLVFLSVQNFIRQHRGSPLGVNWSSKSLFSFFPFLFTSF